VNLARRARRAYLGQEQKETAMFKGLGGLGGLGDMAMMKKAQEMQARMAEMQEQMARTVVIGEAGAGLVKARVTAKGEVTGLDIDASILVPSEKEVIEDLIIAAIQDAQARGAARQAEEMRKLTESLGLPADMKLPF
jgi:DNA-binding YbaB/EbfC family protein